MKPSGTNLHWQMPSRYIVTYFCWYNILMHVENRRQRYVDGILLQTVVNIGFKEIDQQQKLAG